MGTAIADSEDQNMDVLDGPVDPEFEREEDLEAEAVDRDATPLPNKGQTQNLLDIPPYSAPPPDEVVCDYCGRKDRVPPDIAYAKACTACYIKKVYPNKYKPLAPSVPGASV